MKRTLSILVVIALGMMTACNKLDNNTEPEAPVVYSVNIPATIGGEPGTKAVTFDNSGATPTSNSTFEASEKVYVYNATTGKMLEGYLTPTGISADGKKCNLTGTLTGTISDGNSLTLLYNLTSYSSNPTLCTYYYGGQNGTQSGVVDGATATVTASGDFAGGILTTAATASFQSVQSMFRFKFVDETSAPITVATLHIQSTGWDIAAYYMPLAAEGSRYNTKEMTVTPSTPTSDYLYGAICIREGETPSALEFTATDASGNEYKGTKTAPSGGFKNGRYYYNTSAITLTKQAARIAPDITWTSVANNTPVTPSEYTYYVYGPYNSGTSSYDPSEFSISGTSSGYRFYMNYGATIHISGLTATYDEDRSFFYSSDGALNLDISGTNSITQKNYDLGIWVASGTLKLSGSGTLTITVKSSTTTGITGSNYTDGTSDPNALAATGYTVTRSARTDNGDGTYSWTYTVRPSFSVSSTRKVVFAPGNLQAVFAAANTSTCTWQFAPTQYSYIGNATANTAVGNNVVTTAGTVDLFGWVGASASLAAYGINNNDNNTIMYGDTANEALMSDWSVAANAANLGGHNDWRTLTIAEWGYLFETRTDASQKYGHGSVNGVKGMIILPDEWVLPAGLSFTPGNSTWANTYTTAQWAKMEANGAVFLPAAGSRNGTTVSDVDTFGYYWSSTSHEVFSGRAYYMAFYSSYLSLGYNPRRNGYSVRLVRNAE